VVDLAEGILDVVGAVDIVFWPVALDFKRDDVEAMEDGSILATFINGAVRTTEQREMCELLRRKSAVMVAFGSCSQMGGIPGLANLYTREETLARAYDETPSTVNPEGTRPQAEYTENGHTAELPEFYHTVLALDQVVEVEYAIPGCAPTPNVISDAVTALLSGDLPPAGTVLSPDVALCEGCSRIDSKPQELGIKAFKRPHEIMIDEELCLLAQGLLCLGPATRSGCGALCIDGNMPCTGCFGPTSHVRDQGGKILSALASMIDARDEAEIDAILDTIPDPVGTFYRYGLPHSMLRRKKTPIDA
jgi:F420-non-reducing hydrogenase small subunit